MVKAVLVWFMVLAGGGAACQALEFSEVKRLPAGVNSSGEESVPLLAPDGRKLYFVRSIYDGNTGGTYAGQDIWVSEKTKTGGWTPAKNRIGYLNNKDNNVIVGISRDGKGLFTMNSSPEAKVEGFYLSTENNNLWTRPSFEFVGGIENQDFVGMYITPDAEVMFISMRGADSMGEEDLYISLRDRSGAWSPPRNLGPTINSRGFEISPFLSADKKRLYFASDGHGGFGDADIFYCERLYNSWETWSAPVNLGEVVNTRKFDAYFSIYGDSVAFFTSNREQALADIYTARVSEKIGVLPAGFQYLTNDEWDQLIGPNVLRKLTFENRSTSLTTAQKELLYFIADRISTIPGIGFHLLVRVEDDPVLTTERLRAIYGHLRQLGIESNRIREDQSASFTKQSADESVIDVLLFKAAPK